MDKRDITQEMLFGELLTLHQIAEGAIPAPDDKQSSKWVTVKALMDAGMVETRKGKLRLADTPEARYWNKVSQIIHQASNIQVAGFKHRTSINAPPHDPKFSADLVKAARAVVDAGSKLVGVKRVVAACW